MEKGLKNFDKYYEYFKNHNTDVHYENQLKLAHNKRLELVPGNYAPQFTLLDINDNKVSLEDFRGQYVYLDFWQTLCSRSARELPYLSKLQSDYASDDIVFLSISVDQDKNKWKTYVKKKNKNFSINLWSENYFSSKVFEDYQVRGLLSFVLIDKEGKILDPVAAKPLLKT